MFVYYLNQLFSFLAMNKFCLLLTGSLCQLISLNIFSQPAAIDSAGKSLAERSAISNFNEAMEVSGLYSGIEYKAHPANIIGSPYFQDTNNWNKETVVYNNTAYANVPLKYDLVDDELTALLYNGFSAYVLNKKRVSAFHMLGHYFIYAAADSMQKESFEPGFYEQLYKLKTRVLIKRTKSIATSTSLNNLETRYEGSTRYYLYNNGIYYKVSGNSSVVDALQDKKKEIQQYIKSNRIKVNKNPQAALVQIASYYDSLTR